ncbi:TOP6B-like family protein [Clavibacter sepedonicus]|uniref:TOP6B-like family protein n=1 Tax=Clavibacter TaxID=1573 RepID=UPI001CC25CFC|nr:MULTISPECIES: TOP6B-like family protein [Clavibacter]UUK66288.1 TOP6B-like family protein [Clavibacter sepedonicus]
MTRRSDGDGEPTGVDPRFDPAFQRAAGPGPHPPQDPQAGAAAPGSDSPTGEPRSQPQRTRETTESRAPATDRPALAGWLAPVLWILAVAFPAAGLGLRALAAGIATSMPYSSFGDPLGQRWLLDAVPLLVTLAPGVVAGGPMAVIAALAVHATRRRSARAATDDPGAGDREAGDLRA